MTTFLLYLLALIVVVGLIKAAAWLLMEYLLADEPGADETRTVTTADGWTIQLYRYNGGGEPVFFCHGLMANQFNFTYPIGDSLVDALKQQGYDCWTVDLRGTRSSRAPLGKSRFEGTLDDYLLQDIPAALGYIRKRTGYPQVHWIGHSMGGMLLYAYELIHGRDEIATGTTIASPPTFHNIPAQRSRQLLHVIRRFPGPCSAAIRIAAALATPFKLNLPWVPINWANTHKGIGAATAYNVVDMPSPEVLHTMSRWAWTNAWMVNNGTVNVMDGLRELKTPLMTIFAERDPLAPPENGKALNELLTTRDKELLILGKAYGQQEDYSHIDPVCGICSREEVFAPIATWLAQHPMEGRPPEALDAAEVIEFEPAATAGGVESNSSWGRALQNAANVLVDLERDGPDGGQTVAKLRVTRKRTAAKHAKVRKSASKTGAKKLKPRKKAAKKKTTSASRKSPTKKKLTAKKKSSGKKKTTKKPVSRKKTSTKKKTTTKKQASKRKAATGRTSRRKAAAKGR